MQFGERQHSKTTDVETGKFYSDLKDLLRRHPFTDSQLDEVYHILEGRLRHISCTQCQKLVPKHKTKLYGNNLDNLRPVCQECFEKLP